MYEDLNLKYEIFPGKKFSHPGDDNNVLLLPSYKVKVKQSRYRPEVPRGFQEVKVPRLHDNGTGWL